MNGEFSGRGIIYDLKNWTYFEGSFKCGRRYGEGIDYFWNGDYEYASYNCREKKEGKALFFKNDKSEPIVRVYKEGEKTREF